MITHAVKRYIDSLEKAGMWGQSIAKEMEDAISQVIPDVRVIHDSSWFCFYIHSEEKEGTLNGSISIENVFESIFPELKGYFYSSIIYVTEEEAERIKDAIKVK